MRAALLVLLLALPVGAQEKTVLEVREGTITTMGGETVPVTGGAYLDGPALLSTAKELAALKAENVALREAPGSPPAVLLVTAVVCLLAGAALGVAVGARAGK